MSPHLLIGLLKSYFVFINPEWGGIYFKQGQHMTAIQKEIISSDNLLLRYNFHSLARDLNGKVFGFTTPPTIGRYGWGTSIPGPVIELSNLFVIEDISIIKNWKLTLRKNPELKKIERRDQEISAYNKKHYKRGKDATNRS